MGVLKFEREILSVIVRVRMHMGVREKELK